MALILPYLSRNVLLGTSWNCIYLFNSYITLTQLLCAWLIYPGLFLLLLFPTEFPAYSINSFTSSKLFDLALCALKLHNISFTHFESHLILVTYWSHVVVSEAPNFVSSVNVLNSAIFVSKPLIRTFNHIKPKVELERDEMTCPRSGGSSRNSI